MEDPVKPEESVIQSLQELEEYAKVAQNRLRVLLRQLPKEEKIARIKSLNLTDRSLDFLCVGIALETEDYEICSAVEEIKKERALSKKAIQTPAAGTPLV